MLSYLILAAVPALASAATLGSEPVRQSVQMTKNGEFLAKNYPPRALRNGEEGRVGFRLVVEPDGGIGICDVTESSGHASLDNETCEMLVRNARIQPIRNADGRAVRAVQNGYINWKLPPGYAKAADTSGTVSAGRDPERIICKKSQTTGSLVRKTKQCMTARQWAESQRITRDEAERLIGSGHFEDESGGN